SRVFACVSVIIVAFHSVSVFFLTDPAPPATYTLSLHDALPIFVHGATVEDGALIGMGAIVLSGARIGKGAIVAAGALVPEGREIDRKSTRLNSSHVKISYAVFCLKKKSKPTNRTENGSTAN